MSGGRNTLVWRRVVADTETPVGGALKLIEEGRGDFLLELVEGGEIRGRYSLLGLDPDLVFRATGAQAESIGNGAMTARRSSRCRRQHGRIARARAVLPHRRARGAAARSCLPCRLFRLRDDRPGRKLPRAPQSDLALPDMLFARPALVLVFDGLPMGCSSSRRFGPMRRSRGQGRTCERPDRRTLRRLAEKVPSAVLWRNAGNAISIR